MKEMKKIKRITIPISECDIEMFEKLVHSNYDPIEWSFDNEEDIFNIRFVKENQDEYD